MVAVQSPWARAKVQA